MQKKLNPWDVGPTELIQFAIERMHGGTEFDKRLSFLILDVGVETLFKTFLTIPDGISHVKTGIAKRKEAASGSFHALVNGIREAIPDRAKELNLEHVQFYHDIRNTLYHQGNTVAAVRMDQLRDYAELAVKLLRELLGVDLTDNLIPPINESTTGNDPIVDSVEVELGTGRYRLVRLKSKTIQIFSVDTGKSISPVKPFLRKIIQELSLPVDLFIKSGSEKNTRLLGKNIIDELKPSAWHGWKAGQKVSRDKLVSMLTSRILNEKADPKNWDIVKQIQNLDQEVLVFQPVGKAFGNSPFNLNCWYTESGDPIK